MLYLEELVDAVIAEEGQTLMGLDFLIDALNLSMEKIELIFKKALWEYSERRPMKKTQVFNYFDYTMTDANGEAGFIKMPEGTTSCRVARYGVMPSIMPRYYMAKFEERGVEFDPYTLTCKVWPPVAPIRLTYTQRYVPTKNTLIETTHMVPYESNEAEFVLGTSYAAKTLTIQKSVPTGSTAAIKTMTPTGYIEEEEVDGEIIRKAELSGTLGEGYVNLKTREVKLDMDYDDISPLIITYYPKYSVIKDLDIGDFIFTKLFASKFLGALASLRSQASQEKLHGINLKAEELYDRVNELRREIHDEFKHSFSFGSLAPQ